MKSLYLRAAFHRALIVATLLVLGFEPLKLFGAVDEDRRNASPFRRFFGEWTLKEDRWSQNWGQGDQHLTIRNHHTLIKDINTPNSVLSVVNAREPRGHILWSFDPATQEVHHLSSFGTARNGVGKGRLSDAGDLTLKVAFSNEAPGTYRIYTYKWVTDDEYELRSVQYDAEGAPTGFFYAGSFVRIRPEVARTKDEAAIKAILRVIDDNNADSETMLSVYADDVVHMAPDEPAHIGKAALGQHLQEAKKHGHADMTHEIVEMVPFENIILMRGQVTGTYHPRDGATPFAFQTKNLFVFRREPEGSLKVWKVIFNMSPRPKS